MKVMRMAKIMWLLLFLSFITLANADSSLYSLQVPSEYVLFMGPLEFGYRIPANVSLPHAFVKVEYHGKNTNTTLTITAIGLTRGKKEDTLSIACGHLEFAGVYTLSMFTWVNGKLLTQANVKVVWPEILMSLPDHHEVQTTNANVHILSPAECYSHVDRFPMHVKLLFQRTLTSPTQRLHLPPSAETIAKLNFSSPLLTKEFLDFTLPCYLFDLNGYYQVVLESSAPETPLVSKSNVMAVDWSKQYSLKHTTATIFPCKDYLTITYTRPACSPVDKIRMFSLHRMVEGSMASPMRQTLLGEWDTSLDTNKMMFGCEMLNRFNESAAGFLFTYVSVSKGLEKFYTTQTQLIVSAWPDSEYPIDGGWGHWSAWSTCSVSCGIGKRNRVRMCDSPAPKHGGFYCDGSPFQWKPCSMNCTVSEAEEQTVSPLQSFTVDPNCVCGCTKKDEEGEIIGSGRCNDTAVWFIRTQRQSWVVSLSFGFFGLDDSRQLVLVRDGPSASDDLLFSSWDAGYPLEIVSSGAVLRVEMKTFHPRSARTSDRTTTSDKDKAKSHLYDHGFVAQYKSMANHTGITSPVLHPYHDDKTVMGSSVTIIGIVLCAIIIIATVIFVILQRTLLQKRVKYRSAPVSGSPSHPQGLVMTQSDNHLSIHQHQQQHAHLTTSQISSSNASSPDAGTILVDMEKPLTGKHKTKTAKSDADIRGDNKLHSSKHQHSSKSKSKSSAYNNKNKIKLFKPPTSSESSSPKPSTKDYSSVQSGRGLDSEETDESGTKDSSKHIHFKPKPSPMNPSPIMSKFDILKNKSKRKKTTSESSDTSTSQKCRSGVSTTKAEVNWPQNNFVKTAWNEMGKPFYDRHRPGQRPPSEEIPLIDTSSQESPSHVNNLVKSESTDSTFLPKRASGARRPTSLTESYSSVQSKCDELTITESPSEPGIEPMADPGTLKRGDIIRPRPTPTQTPSSSITPTSNMYNVPSLLSKTLTPTSPALQKIPLRETVPFNQNHSSPLSKPKTPSTPQGIPVVTTTATTPRKLPSLRPPPSTSSPSSKSFTTSPLKIDIPQEGKKDCTENSPKPPSSASSIDHQRKFSSPNPSIRSLKLSRSNSQTQKLRNSAEAPSPGIVSKCSSRGSKTNISSPTRSITTPSEAEGLELEYDDFIEDDPLSYFDYEQTQKLAFRGSEKIGKSPIEEDDEDDTSGRH